MSALNKGSGQEIEVLDWKIPEGEVLIRSVSGFRVNWYYYNGSNADIILLSKKRSSEYKKGAVRKLNGKPMTGVPIVTIKSSYNGKRLSKWEMRFLLNAHKEWGSYLVSNPEYVGSLLKMLTILRRRDRKEMVLDSLRSLGWGLFGSGMGVYIVAQVGGIPPAAIGISAIGGFALFTTLFGYMNFKSGNYHTSRVVEPSRLMWHSNKAVLYPDFHELHDYLDVEHREFSEKNRSKIGPRPKPWLVAEYKEKATEIRKELAIENYRYETARINNQKAIAEKKYGAYLDPVVTIPPVKQPVSAGSWVNSHGILNKVKEEWLSWEMDILRVVQYPALFNAREPATADFHKAFMYAESIQPASTSPYSVSHPYLKAVTDLKFAWEAAKSEAERIEQSNFNDEERERLARALDLLRIALNTGGTPAERQGSYKRAMVQLKGLIDVPDKTIIALESGLEMKVLE